MGAIHKLERSLERLKNPFQTGKARNWEEVPAQLRQHIDGLCEGQLKWPLFLHGPVGTGKSCAALCLIDHVAKSEFWAMPALVDFVRNVQAGRQDWYECGRGGTWTTKGWWQRVANMPLLVLDDVGLREVSDDFQMETLFLALEARDGKPLILTSNLDPKEIQQLYNVRIRSRACSGIVYHLRGRDRRYAEGEQPTD